MVYETIPKINLRFEYEIRDGKFNLYERGGCRYLARNLSGEVRGNKGPNKELDMLYPVIQLAYNKESHDNLMEMGIRAFLGMHKDIGKLFSFTAKDMDSKKVLEGIAIPKRLEGPELTLEKVLFFK